MFGKAQILCCCLRLKMFDLFVVEEGVEKD